MNYDKYDTEDEMLWAAQDLRTITSNQTEVTISRRIILSPINSGPKWDYMITFGDLMNRGKWRWEHAQAETLERAVEIALAHAAMQGSERNRELAALRESAAKLGATLIENAALRESAAKLGATLVEATP
jgi:hypothetical protein